MQGDSIGEVRGVLDNQQNLEGNMTDIAEEKMNNLPGAEKYRKASADMKQLTAIDKKTKAGEELNKDDLVFLYEINNPIEGFGYQTDPRIKEIIATRNPEADMPIVFEYTPEQIAHNTKEINQDTKAFVGPLQEGIFNLIQQYNIEHIYTSYPEGKIRQYQIEIGGKTKAQLEQELKARNIWVSNYAQDLLNSPYFSTSKNKEQANLVRLTVEDLGFPEGATTDKIYKRAEKLGLELCPAEVGPNLRLQYTGKEWILIGMKQISDRDGDPDVFYLTAGGGQLGLSSDSAWPVDLWDDDFEFVFRFRKSEI